MKRTSAPGPAAPVGGRDLRARFAFWVAASGGMGLSPVWPGTAGAALGVAIAFALVLAGPLVSVAVLIGLFVLGAWAASVVETEWAIEDPQFVSVDETFGAAATLCLLPPEPAWWAAGFLAFRVLDVAKPWPASLVHRTMRGGLAIMLDDAIAAVMAAVLLLAAKPLFAGLL